MVARRGAAEAGAIFIRIFFNSSCVRLLCAPPGQAHDEAGERLWHSVSGDSTMTSHDAEEYVAKQSQFDPDIWVIDIDDKNGTGLLTFGTP